MSQNDKEFDGHAQMEKSGLRFNKLDPQELLWLQEVLKRASEMVVDLGYGPKKIGFDWMLAEMDILAVHSNGCPLNLFTFLNQSADDFFHDFVGIHKAIDRSTGKLTEGFVPKCAASKPTYQ